MSVVHAFGSRISTRARRSDEGEPNVVVSPVLSHVKAAVGDAVQHRVASAARSSVQRSLGHPRSGCGE